MLPKTPPKGTCDLHPKDFAIRKYIFDTWRRVCESFGYEEYLWPLVERADIWRVKSGEDVWGTELTLLTDKSGAIGDLALRPEMTPTVTRMVAGIYRDRPKPIRYFSIANFYRNERPQKGRNREFWQLNLDMFGNESVNADVEIIQIAIEIMLAFGAKKEDFRVRINNRKLLNVFLTESVLRSYSGDKKEEVLKQIIRAMDKFKKVTESEFQEMLRNIDSYFRHLDRTTMYWDWLPNISISPIDRIIAFLRCTSIHDLLTLLEDAQFSEIFNTDDWMKIRNLFQVLEELWYGEYIEFDPACIRGFDYYDGMVFEVFDTNTENSRSLFGGGRYNGLASIFGEESFPAVGFAPGDETFRMFLEGHNLLPNIGNLRAENYFVPVIQTDESTDKNAYFSYIQQIAKTLRWAWKNVETGLEETSIKKALEYANKRELHFVVIVAEDEFAARKYKIKNMKTGEEIEYIFTN